jgi:glutamine amidotransferase
LAETPASINVAQRLILPGVGHFDHAMEEIERRGLVPALSNARDRGVPILGICLGAQLLLSGSDEGNRPGLAWIPGRVRRFVNLRDAVGRPLPVPNMGWRRTSPRVGHPVTDSWVPESRFYYVHSYYLDPDRPADVLATADYGGEFCSAVAADTTIGVQFHPEKSHRFGMAVLRSFMAWQP